MCVCAPYSISISPGIILKAFPRPRLRLRPDRRGFSFLHTAGRPVIRSFIHSPIQWLVQLQWQSAFLAAALLPLFWQMLRCQAPVGRPCFSSPFSTCHMSLRLRHRQRLQLQLQRQLIHAHYTHIPNGGAAAAGWQLCTFPLFSLGAFHFPFTRLTITLRFKHRQKKKGFIFNLFAYSKLYRPTNN